MKLKDCGTGQSLVFNQNKIFNGSNCVTIQEESISMANCDGKSLLSQYFSDKSLFDQMPEIDV